MAIETVQEFISTLRDNRLLEPTQSDELTRDLQPRFADARALARHLIQQNWLTPYQINQLFQGRAGSLVLGSYVVLERIGEGGMGQVFKARHSKLGRVVAVKVIRKEHLSHPDAIRRFHREIRLVAQLSHPNIVMAYDADQVGETHFFVMEYVEGGNLSHLVKYQGVPPIAVACDYVRQVALGLQHGHERGMVHRDIKPANLLVVKPTNPSADRPASLWGATIKILDMGVARMLQAPDPGDSASALTKEGRVVGTPDYMAPEQAVNSAKADIRADLYSLGCTFYQMLTNHLPYPGGTPMEKLLKHRIETPRPVEQLRPDVPPGVAAVLRKMMAKKADDRYPTPDALVAAMDALTNRPAAVSAGAPPVAVPVAAQAAYAPAAVAIMAGPPPAVPIPLASPVEDNAFAFSVGEPGSGDVNLSRTEPGIGASASRSSAARLLKAARSHVNWPAIIAAIVVMILGGVVLIFALRPAPPRRGGAPESVPDDPRAAALRDLATRPAATPEQAADVRRELLRFRADNLGTPEAADVARLLMRLPSPLDDLKHDNLPSDERDRPSNLEAVGVLGESRQRHWGPVRCVNFGPDGKVLASGGDDSVVRLWDPINGRERAVLPVGSSVLAVHCGGMGPGRLTWAFDNNGTVTGWEIPTFANPRKRLPVQLRQQVSWAVFSPNGQYLAFFNNNQRQVQYCSLTESGVGKPVVVPAPAGAFFSAGEFHPKKPLLAIADNNNEITLWDLNTDAKPTASGKLEKHTKPVSALTFNKEGTRLASFSPEEHTLRLWDTSVEPAVELTSLGGVGTSRFNPSLAFSDDGLLLALGGREGQVFLWRVGETLEPLPPVFPKATAWINHITFAGRLLAVAGQDVTVRLWELGGRVPQEVGGPLHEPFGAGQTVVFSPLLPLLATGHDGEGVFRLWDLRRGTAQTYPRLDPASFHAAFAPDGRTLAVAQGTRAGIQIWKLVADGRWEAAAPAGDPAQLADHSPVAAFGPSGKILAASVSGNLVKLYDISGERPREFAALAGHTPPIVAIAFAPDGKTVATAGSGADASVRLWDVNAHAVHELKSFPLSARSLAFSPKGDRVAVASETPQGNADLRLLELGENGWTDSTPTWKRSLTGRLTSTVFTPDGEMLFAGSSDGSVVLFNLVGVLTHSWTMGGPVRDLSVANDGRHVAVANGNGTVCILRYRTAPRGG